MLRKVYKNFQRGINLQIFGALNLEIICAAPHHPVTIYEVSAFVCVEVLRPSQPNGVMSSAVSLPKHTFTGQA